MRVLLFSAVAVAVYAALYYCAGPKSRAEATPPRHYSLGKVVRHLLLGMAMLLAIDGAIFHSGFYTKFLKRDSYAGSVALIVAEERDRARSGTNQEIALLGDSRMFEAFSASAANQRGEAAGLKFTNLAVAGCYLRVWYYALRELDPKADRYRAIIVPVRYSDRDRGRSQFDDDGDIRFAAPFLRYGDAREFAGSFPKWPAKCRAFIACFLRGLAFRDDLHDLLAHPARRFRERGADSNFLSSRQEYAGNERALEGISFDPGTKEISVPEHLSELREPLQNSIRPHKDRGLYKQYRTQWLGRILDHYARSSTTIVLVQMPRGPVGGPPDSLTRAPSIAEFTGNGHCVALDSQLFEALERPAFFADRAHVNAAGRKIFTEILTSELLTRFRNSPANEATATAPE